MAEGEVGKVGVSICSIDDMETLFRDIPLETVTTSMTINATAVDPAGAVRRGREEAGRRPGEGRRHDAERHPEGVHRARDVHLPAAAVAAPDHRLSSPGATRTCRSGTRSASAATTCARPAARRRRRSASRSPTRSQYTQAALDRGLKIDDFAPRLAFFFACHSNFLEEIAKFRAARRLWARVVKERFGAKDPRSHDAALPHADGRRDADGAAADQQPRAHGAAGAVGRAGRDAVAAHEQLRRGALAAERSTRPSWRCARSRSSPTRRASATRSTRWPGSWYIEHLTDEVERDAEDYVRRIDEMGGALAAVERGFQAQEIHENAFRIQRDIEAHRKIVVGVNEFVDEEPPPDGPAPARPSPSASGARSSCARLRADRDAGAAEAALQRLEDGGARRRQHDPADHRGGRALRDAGRDLPRACAASGASSASRWRCRVHPQRTQRGTERSRAKLGAFFDRACSSGLATAAWRRSCRARTTAFPRSDRRCTMQPVCPCASG